MSDPTTPVADDDFPEFAEPPRHKPSPEAVAKGKPAAESAQDQVDDVIARLRAKRDKGDG